MHWRRFIHALLIALPMAGCTIQSTPAWPTLVQLPTLEDRTTQTPTFAARITTTPSPTVTLASTITPRAPTATSPAPIFTRTPAPLALPDSAMVKGMYGYGQLLPLSCESRSAADWARHFGIQIHELEFFAHLPKSKNPEEGFVGSPYGGWGLVPPEAYGVHAVPVAAVLNGSYGARAKAVRNLPFEKLQAEIAAGRPVMVWITGHVEPGKGIDYSVDGKTITVARYEHTVIVIGYDKKHVTILDGKTVYQRTFETFLQSWKALGNMAIIWETGA